MGSPNLPINVDTTYADDAGDASVKLHQQHHDSIHTIINQFDANGGLLINTQTASYTLVASDVQKLVEMNVATANNLTIPNSVFAAGQYVQVRQYGAGATSIVAGSGVTLKMRGNTTGTIALNGQYSEGTITFRSASEAIFSGDAT